MDIELLLVLSFWFPLIVSTAVSLVRSASQSIKTFRLKQCCRPGTKQTKKKCIPILSSSGSHFFHSLFYQRHIIRNWNFLDEIKPRSVLFFVLKSGICLVKLQLLWQECCSIAGQPPYPFVILAPQFLGMLKKAFALQVGSLDTPTHIIPVSTEPVTQQLSV